MKRKKAIVFAVPVLIFVFLFVWPTLYRYDRIDFGAGRSFPTRTNRITGKTQQLTVDGWYQMGATETTTFPLSQNDVRQLAGQARVTAEGKFEAKVYNGTTRQINDIMVSITALNAAGPPNFFVEESDIGAGVKRYGTFTVAFKRRYILRPDYPSLTGPMSATTYNADLGFTLNDSQTFEWEIIGATAE